MKRLAGELLVAALVGVAWALLVTLALHVRGISP